MNENTSTTSSEREAMLEELLVRVTTHWYDPQSSGKTQILLGQLPSLPVNFPLSEGSSVLGTLIHSPETAEIVLDTPLSPEQVVAFYKERLSGEGWMELDRYRGHRQSGFTHAGVLGTMNDITLCKDVDTPSFYIQAFSGRGAMTDVRININGGEHSPCRQQQRGPKSRLMEHHGLYDLIPTLVPPAGAKQMGGGGSSGSDSVSSHATLETDAELATLAPHYAKQLEAGGWTKLDEGQSGPLAWNAWTFQDEDNEPWRGTFFIWKSPGKQREYSLHVEARWDTEEKPSSGWFGTSSTFNLSSDS